MATLMTKKQFRTWLEGQEPDAIDGETYQERSCPIANALKARGYERSIVGNENVAVVGKFNEYLYRSWHNWMLDFVRAVDSDRDIHLNDSGYPIYAHAPVTASEALRVLNGLS